MKYGLPWIHLGTLAALSIVIGAPTLVTAEPFVALYGGIAMPQTAMVTTTVNQSGGLLGPVSQFTGSRQADFSSSFTVGGRIGYWIDRAPWFGFAFDLSYFPARASSVQIDAIPFSFLVMSRVPLLASEQFPKGRLRPYAGVGPSFVLASASTDFSPTVPPADETSKTVGLDVRAGLDWLFTPHLSLFAEYRFFNTKVKAETKCELLCFGPSTTSTITTNLNAHTVSGGLAYHF